MVEMRNAYKILVQSHRNRWEDNIIMVRWEIGREFVDWMHLVQDMDKLRALVNTVMNIRVL